MNRSLRLAAVAALGFACPLSAQETLTSDRPGIGSGAGIVQPGYVQFETGFDYAEDTTNRTWSIGQMLVRIGVTPKVEIEAFVNSWSTTDSDFADDVTIGDGFQDLGMGVKTELFRNDAIGLSLQGILTTPTGWDGFTADEWVPTANLLADFGVTDRLGVSINSGYQAGPGDVSDQFALFVTPGVTLDGGFGFYAGWAAFFRDFTDAHFAEAGFTLLVNPNLQLDVSGGWDLAETDTFFLGAGAAFRFGG